MLFTIIFLIILFALFIYVVIRAAADYNDFIERELYFQNQLNRQHLEQHFKRLENTREQMNE